MQVNLWYNDIKIFEFCIRQHFHNLNNFFFFIDLCFKGSKITMAGALIFYALFVVRKVQCEEKCAHLGA